MRIYCNPREIDPALIRPASGRLVPEDKLRESHAARVNPRTGRARWLLTTSGLTPRIACTEHHVSAACLLCSGGPASTRSGIVGTFPAKPEHNGFAIMGLRASMNERAEARAVVLQAAADRAAARVAARAALRAAHAHVDFAGIVGK